MNATGVSGPNIMLKKIAAGSIAGILIFAGVSFGQIASDNAGNYGGGWTNGSNGGTGFTAWDLTQNNNDNTTNFAGYFTGDSTQGSGNINTGGLSFGIYANPGSAFANAIRGFAEGDLLVGQQFSLQLAVNFRNGNKGMTLNNGGTQLFNFNVGGDAYTYSIGNGSAITLSLAYQPDSIFSLAFTRTAGTTFNISITRTSSAGGTEVGLNQSFDLGATINNFKLYNSGTDAGGAAQNNFYFNNLAITVIPEPTTLSLLGAPALLGAYFLRRRKS